MVRSWLRSEFEAILKAESAQGIKLKVRERKIPEEKIRIVEEACELLKKYRTIVLLDLASTPSKVINYIRRLFEGKGVVKLIKNTLLSKAVDRVGLKNGDEFKKWLEGQNIAIFTNMNAFEVKLLLDKIEVPIKARPGMKVDREIVIPPMRTDLKPGPVMSIFSRFKIPVQVREGVIWIAKEATLLRPGDEITVEITSLLEKLGIEPIVVKPKIKVAYDSGVVIPADKLVIDIEGTKSELASAISQAISVAAEIAIPEPQVLEVSIKRALMRAIELSTRAGFVTPTNAEQVFRNAVSKAMLIAALVASKSPELASALQIQGVVAPQPEQPKEEEKKVEEKKEEEEKKEGISEEQLAEGLAALFG